MQEVIWDTKELNKSARRLNLWLDRLFCTCDYFLQMSSSSLLKDECKKLRKELEKTQMNMFINKKKIGWSDKEYL